MRCDRFHQHHPGQDRASAGDVATQLGVFEVAAVWAGDDPCSAVVVDRDSTVFARGRLLDMVSSAQAIGWARIKCSFSTTRLTTAGVSGRGWPLCLDFQTWHLTQSARRSMSVPQLAHLRVLLVAGCFNVCSPVGFRQV